MNHSELIRDLGGAARVGVRLRARGVQVADVTVRSWSLEGRAIPSKYWFHICEIAREDGQPVSIDALAEAVAVPGTDQGDDRQILCDPCGRRVDGNVALDCTAIDCPHSERAVA